MKKFIVLILIVAFFMISVGCTTISNNATEPDGDGMGPAPNSGDGIPDGSGFDDTGADRSHISVPLDQE